MTKPASALARPWSVETLIRVVLIAGYVGVVALCFTTPWGPRLFWTIVLPLLPVSIVLMGFYAWRRLCPLAFWGTLGLRLKPKGQKVRKVPKWAEQWFFLIAGGFLACMLVVRLVLINGDGLWLGLALIGIGALAAATNFVYSGRTWCNFLCPVGVVERIYTEPNSLRARANSQCAKCTACKQHCPDIDQENAYWKDVSLPARRVAFFAFPGLVLGFYSYYWLRYGDWEAYFDGRWTRTPASLHLAFGPGFFFAPAVPALAAAALTLLGLAALSFGLFAGVEKVVARWAPDAEQARHLTLTLAAFTAFNVFYIFAGAPTLRLIPGGTRVVAFIVPLVAALFLVKRWRRSSDDHLKAKSAKKLLASWKFDAPPPHDPAEVFAFFQAHEQAHTAQLGAYEDAICDVLADGAVTPRELKLLAQLRRDLGVSEPEHRKLFLALSADQKSRLDPASAGRVEQRLQLQGYQAALIAALAHHASAWELEALRADYGIELDVHETLLKELRGDHSPLIAQVQRQLEAAAQVRDVMRQVAAHRGAQFAVFALLTAQNRTVRRAVDALAPLNATGRVGAAAENLFAPDPVVRAAVLNELRAASLPAAIIAVLEPILHQPMPEPAAAEAEAFHRAVQAMAASSDPYQRAGAAVLIGQAQDPRLAGLLPRALADDQALVREAAIYAAARTGTEIDAPALGALRQDSDPRVRAALATVAEAPPVLGLAAGDESLPGGQEHFERLLACGLSFSNLALVDKILFLDGVPLFASLEPEDLHELSDLARERVFSLSEILVKQGDLTDDLFVVTLGQAVVTVERQGQPQEMWRAAAGDVVGEMSAIDGEPQSATVLSASDRLYTLQIRGDDFRRLLGRRPDLATQLMKTMALRLRQSLASS